MLLIVLGSNLFTLFYEFPGIPVSFGGRVAVVAAINILPLLTHIHNRGASRSGTGRALGSKLGRRAVDYGPRGARDGRDADVGGDGDVRGDGRAGAVGGAVCNG